MKPLESRRGGSETFYSVFILLFIQCVFAHFNYILSFSFFRFVFALFPTGNLTRLCTTVFNSRFLSRGVLYKCRVVFVSQMHVTYIVFTDVFWHTVALLPVVAVCVRARAVSDRFPRAGAGVAADAPRCAV